MSIKADVNELEAIRFELKQLTLKRKALREREKVIEGRISAFLKSKEQVGVKHNGTAIVIVDKQVAAPKKPKDRDADTISVLEKWGIEDPEKALAEIMAVRKGDKIMKEKVCTQKIKN